MLSAQGLSGSEIAQKLTLALNSVKSHIQHLYGKLGVNRRHQPLVRAAELGLLAPPAAKAMADPEPQPDPHGFDGDNDGIGRES